MRIRFSAILLLVVLFIAGIAPLPHGLLASPEGGYTAKLIKSWQVDSIVIRKGMDASPKPAPSGSSWFAVTVEFTLSGKEAELSLKKLGLTLSDGKRIRPVAMAPEEMDFALLEDLEKGTSAGAKMVVLTAKGGLLFYFRGGKLGLQLKEPVPVRFLFELPAGKTPLEIELDKTTKLKVEQSA